MAAMVRLHRQTDQIVEESYRRKNEAENQREKEFVAALKIQAWFRGSRTRAYMTHLNNSANTIQKRWRGYLGRRYFRILVKNSVLIMKLNHYNEKATKIQKMWRGYYTRKYVFNYYSRKRYLEALQIKNEIVRSELEEYAEQQAQIAHKKLEVEESKKREHEARKYHYLISTEVIPGIFNSPFLPYPSEKEYILRSVKPLVHKKKKALHDPYDPVCRSYDLPKPKQLPPLTQKPQGPFRDPTDVQKQRYKPFQQTLRVATSFTALEEARQEMKAEEWVTRLNDNVFVPFTKKDQRYEPMLHTTSQYGHLPFGTRFYREEFLDKHIVPKPFKTLVPSIPIFDKLNDTYSQGQV
ncbi:spermatogenesis-associated protein 17-like [Ylistrum balloti]|uniref:spermatogenesis-associated protein 17-like n=1 Tax=Ylistrum balloti TaxID=509963 RepID=UPI002905A8F7|nr:spermatogenesis-associated protein 17-like [Ylistrum balloti]